jgi:predicted dinucleotide-binding enzyme
MLVEHREVQQMKIAVIGAGHIGGTLATKWAQTGHEVRLGVRDVHSSKSQSALQAGGDIAVQSIAAAVSYGESILLAVPGNAVEAIVNDHAKAFGNKVVIDATNQVGAAEMSAVPSITRQAPHARVFRAFNALGWENFAEPVIGGVQADLFYCGADDRQAREAVEKLIENVGLRPVYVGGLDQLQVVDNLTRLWFALAHGRNMGRHLAFKLLMP